LEFLPENLARWEAPITHQSERPKICPSPVVNVIAFFLVLPIVFQELSLASVPFERALDVLKACSWITEQLMPLWLLRIDYSKTRTENNNSAPNHQITPDFAFVEKYDTKPCKNCTHMSSESSKLIT
jgi:hypothetical protein